MRPPAVVADLGERGLLARIREAFPARSPDVLLGIGDDAAVVRPGRRPLILTKDLLVENVDFVRRLHPARFIGRKSLAVNLSDIAAMGAEPRYALLGLGLPSRLPLSWVEDFLAGFRSMAREFRVDLVGGDVSRSTEIVISVTVVGEGESPLRRDGASAGDGIYVSGTLGDAALGFALLKRRPVRKPARLEESLFRAFLDPKPQVALGRALHKGRLASAAIDVSDGLSVDLRHLCEAGGTGAEVDLGAIPLSAGMKALGGKKALDYALNGGEDFQLLFCVRPADEKSRGFRALIRRIPLTRIGRMVDGRGVSGVDARGRRAPLPARGYEHFKSKG